MSSPLKEFHIDAVYPEHLTRLRNRGAPKSDLPSSSVSARRSARKNQRKGNAARFRTQPVTFHEIKEVDEDNLIEAEELGGSGGTIGSISKSESDLKLKFELFYKSITKDSGNADEVDTKDANPTISSTAATDTVKNQGSISNKSQSSASMLPAFNTRSRPSL